MPRSLLLLVLAFLSLPACSVTDGLDDPDPDPELGAYFVRVTIDGDRWEARPDDEGLSQATVSGQVTPVTLGTGPGQQVSVAAGRGNAATRTADAIAIVALLNASGDPVPDAARIGFVDTDGVSWNSTADVDVAFTDVTDSELRGTFAGVVFHEDDTGASRTLVDGSFVVPVTN